MFLFKSVGCLKKQTNRLILKSAIYNMGCFVMFVTEFCLLLSLLSLLLSLLLLLLLLLFLLMLTWPKTQYLYVFERYVLRFKFRLQEKEFVHDA